MTPRLIATDLDGTLLRPDGSLSRRTVTTLRAVEATGATVVIVTGRPPRWMVPVAKQLGHTGLALCANGAVVYDLHSDRIVTTYPLSRATVLEVAEAVRSAVPGVTFAVESVAGGFGREAAYISRDDTGSSPRVGTLDELAGADVFKLLVRHPTLAPDDLLAAAREVAGGLAELTHSSTNGLLEISATGVTKATSLARMAGELGIDASEVVAFGDMPNDLPMLAWAGSAYGMANAHPEVRAAVAQLAPSNQDDGVAQVLERLFDV